MEVFAVLIGILVIGFFLNLVIRAGVGTLRAAARAAMGKGSFSDNFQAAVKGMGPLEASLIVEKASDHPDFPTVRQIRVKGRLPIGRPYRLAFITSLFDNTTDEFMPVTSYLDQFQEPQTRAFQYRTDIGAVEPDIGYVGWTPVGVIVPALIQAPYSGKRALVAILRLIDLDNRPDIRHGFHEKDHQGLLWQQSLPFEFDVVAQGYLQAAELREKARLACVQIAMAIAVSDGSVGDCEAEMIKRWVEKILDIYSGEKREHLKDEFNRTIKEAYDRVKGNSLSLSELTEKLNEIDEVAIKLETIELCFDVLASRPRGGSDKARMIDLVAKSLKLDPDEVARIRDIKIVSLSSQLSNTVCVEDLLGIEESWSADQVKRHLRMEFQKWNNRLTTLPEGDERDNAQRMLEAISEARKKYG